MGGAFGVAPLRGGAPRGPDDDLGAGPNGPRLEEPTCDVHRGLGGE